MPYTISSTLDVNAQVDVGNLRFNTNTISSINTDGNIILAPDGAGTVRTDNLQFDGNTISSTNTDGDIVFQPNGTGNILLGNSGNVGINNISPTANLYISASSGQNALYINGDCGTGNAQAVFSGSTFGLLITTNNSSDSYHALSIENSSSVSMLHVQNNGFVGVGTDNPKARLHIEAINTGETLNSGSRRYFKYNISVSSDTGTWAFNDVSVYGTGDIITNGYMLSHSATTFSDARIKHNVIDIEDDSALNTLRIIKPKRYNYTDTVLKGSDPVWGFIAQEVSSVLDYAVSKITKEIPNVYKQAIVTNGNTLTIDGFDTSSLSNDTEGNLVTKLLLKTYTNKDIEVTIDTILSSNSIQLTEALQEEDINGTVEGEAFANEIFVYGQYVDDFHVLKKDAIFTVAVAALQEVDRRQTVDNEHILELETENSLQEERITTLEAQVAALLQHTGITV